MPISDLEDFVILAEKLNFSKAAEALHLTQSSLSKKINNLEKKLGFKLFTRTTRSVELTQAGKSFYRDVVELVNSYHQSVARARALSKIEKRVVHIGGDLTNWKVVSAVEAAKTYAATFELPIEIETKSSEREAKTSTIGVVQPLEMALEGTNDIDLLFCSEQVFESPLLVTPLYKERLAFFASVDSGFEHLQEVHLADLKDFFFIETTVNDTLNQRMREVCREAGFEPKTRLHFYESVGDMMKKCASNEVLVTIESTASSFATPPNVSGLVRLTCKDSFATIRVGAACHSECVGEHVEQCLHALREVTAYCPHAPA